MKIEFPALEAEQISVKVKQVTEKGAVALLYKSARVDMDMLDSIVGQDKWTCDYKEIKGNLFCGIGIEIDGAWVWKWDCGVESAQTDGNEKKAEASDAFKRAGFRWGIGRELYTAPFTFLKVATRPKGNGYELADKFARYEVAEIAYDDQRRISRLAIVEAKSGDVVFLFGKHVAGGKNGTSGAFDGKAGQTHAPTSKNDTEGKNKPDSAGRKQSLATEDQITEIRLLADDDQYAACVASYGQNLERMPFAHAVALLRKLKGDR